MGNNNSKKNKTKRTKKANNQKPQNKPTQKTNTNIQDNDKKLRSAIWFGVVVLVMIAVSMILLFALRKMLAYVILPSPNIGEYVNHDLKWNDLIIPVKEQYVMNNGKLYAICYGISACVVSAFFYFVGKKVLLTLYDKKEMKVGISGLLKFVEIMVVMLAVFTFTSKVNSDRNFEDLEIKFNPRSYVEATRDEENTDESNVIGYVKKADLNDDLITVYEAPTSESMLSEEGNHWQEFCGWMIVHVDDINNVSEGLTITLGVLSLVLNEYKKKMENKQV